MTMDRDGKDLNMSIKSPQISTNGGKNWQKTKKHLGIWDIRHEVTLQVSNTLRVGHLDPGTLQLTSVFPPDGETKDATVQVLGKPNPRTHHDPNGSFLGKTSVGLYNYL